MLGFRVWDNQRKLMCSRHYKDHFMINMDGICYEGEPGYLDSCSEALILISDRFIPMQSTGLKDKNGVLIFEGDLIDLTLDEKTIQIKVSSVVDFLMQAGEWNHALEQTYDSLYFEEIIKVVGNVWENPGLSE